MIEIKFLNKSSVTYEVSRLSDREFRGEDLRKVDFYRVDARGTCFEGTHLSGSRLAEGKFNACNMKKAYLARVNGISADFAEANMERASLWRAVMIDANFAGANLTEANLGGAYLLGANFKGANITGINLSGAVIEPQTLKGALIGEKTVIRCMKCGPIGSRDDELVAFKTDQGLVFQTGCFIGGKEDFLAAVQSVHEHSKYGKAYRAAVRFLEEVLI